MKKKVTAVLLTVCVAGTTLAGFQSAGAAEETDIWAPYEETVTLSTVYTENAAAVYPEGDDITNNIWTRTYKEKFNVEVTADWVVDDQDSYNTKLNLSIAEGSLPDVFSVNASQLKQLIEADLIMDITEVYDQYAESYVKEYMEASPDSFESAKSNGKLYAIPQMHYGDMTEPTYIWIRKDWMEEQNLQAPKTVEELTEMMRTFMEAYGGYGMAIDQNLTYLKLLAPAWGAYPNIWLKDESGNIVYGAIQPEMKDALTQWAAWYDEGILSQEFTAMDTAKMYQDVITGQTGVQPFYQWWGWTPGKDVVENLGAESYFVPYELPSVTGEEVLHPIAFQNSAYTVISKECENPEAAFKLINFFAYMRYESKGEVSVDVVNEYMADNREHITGPFRVLNPGAIYDEFSQVEGIIESRNFEDASSSDLESKSRDLCAWLDNREPSGALGAYLQISPQEGAFRIAREVLDNNQVIRSELKGITPETLMNAGSTLDDILTEGFIKIIIGDQPVDYFDELVENWKNAGGEQATQEMNEIYN